MHNFGCFCLYIVVFTLATFGGKVLYYHQRHPINCTKSFRKKYHIMLLVIPFVTITMIVYLYRKLYVKAVDMKGKIVLVTGASSGLGEACAKRFAVSGAKVVLCARNITELRRVKKEITEEESSEWPLVYSMDVTKVDDINNCIHDIEKKYGNVDVLISNAGVSLRGSVVDTSIEVHRKMMEVNYFGAVNLVKAALPSMILKKSGHIVSVGSVQGQLALPYRCAYAASKHASQAFFDSLRAEVASHNINVTVVNPGYIQTNLSINAYSGDGTKHGVLDSTTASGMSPEFAADRLYECVRKPKDELLLADVKAMLGLFLRCICPPLYFKAMEIKGKKEAAIYKKQT